MNRMLHGCPAGPEGQRPIPDMPAMVSDLEAIAAEVTATKKVKAEMRRMVDVIRKLGDLLPRRAEP